MLESQIQTKLIKQYKADGYYVIKLIKCSRSGYPDLLLIKNGVASFVEVKTPKGKIRPMQHLRAKELKKAGCSVKFVTSEGDIPW